MARVPSSFRCVPCGVRIPESQRESHTKSSTHLFREAARGPIVVSSEEEKDSKKKRTDNDDRKSRPAAPKRSRVGPVFIEDLTQTDSGGDSPVRAVNVVDIAAGSVDSDEEVPARFRMQGSSKMHSRPCWWVGGAPRSLHEDVLRFCEWIAPTHAEQHMRAEVLKRYSAIVTRLWPGASAAAFGSTRTALYLPMSDVDLVVLGHTTGSDPLAKLAGALRSSGMGRSVNLIGHARVPIVKLVDKPSNCNVDICINKQTGVSSSLILHQFLESMSALRPLVLILKYFLHQHGMGEVYTGGIGSYCVTLLTISYLQAKEVDIGKLDLGDTLKGFFRFYGDQFNYFRTGISVLNGGAYFDKASRRWTDPTRPYMLSVEDPDTPANDVGKNSYEVRVVRNAFSKAAKDLASNRLSDVLTVPPALLQQRDRVEAQYAVSKTTKKRKGH